MPRSKTITLGALRAAISAGVQRLVQAIEDEDADVETAAEIFDVGIRAGRRMPPKSKTAALRLVSDSDKMPE